MKRALFVIVGLAACALPDGRAQQPKAVLQITCSRPDATYKVGEKVTFNIKSAEDGEATYRATEDGHRLIDQDKVMLKKGNSGSLTFVLDRPGFLQLRIELNKKTAIAAAAVEPTKIQPTAKMPADFDAFWEEGLRELAKVPMDAKLERSDKFSSEQVTCYQVSLANVGGKRVRGWLSVPKGEGPFPAILTVPGAGVYGIGPDVNHARLGALSMNIIIHDIPVDESPEFYKKQSAGPLANYRDIGNDDRMKSYYRTVILGCARCIDYLTSRKDFNGKEVAVTGGSQGGALTLITCGLDTRVTCAAPNVAAMCDHSGVAHDRVSGWPHWLPRTKDKERFAKILETSAYFDAVNFARKFKGPSLHGVGFIDTVCAPTTVYAAFNVMPEPKTMIDSPTMGHSTDPRWAKAREEFWRKHLTLKPPAK